MPSVEPAIFEVKDDSNERGISREENESVSGSGDESEMEVMEAEELETKIIDLSDDEEVEIVAETIDLTGGVAQAETVDVVIDLINDSSTDRGNSGFGTEHDMEVEEVHNNLNIPPLNSEAILDETHLVNDICNKEKPSGDDEVESGKEAETVDEVIDLTDDSKEDQGESRFGIDIPDLNLDLNLEDHLDENELALGKPKKITTI